MFTNEEAVVGACLRANHVIDEAAKYVMPSDFGNWQGEQIFDAILTLHGAKQEVDVLSLHGQLVTMGCKIDTIELHRLQEQVPSASNVAYYAEQVAEASVRRRMARTFQTGLQRANDDAVVSTFTLTDSIAELKAIRDDSPYSSLNGKSVVDVMEVEDSGYDWIIKGLLERGDRYMVTGDEGVGKSLLFTQIGLFSAAGIHPFYLYPMEPLNVVMLDFENTERQWRRKASRTYQAARTIGKGDLNKFYLENDVRGIDLLSTKGLGYVHKVLDRHPADLLIMGPLYKLVPKAINTDDDAAPLLKALDSLRERGCSLLLEAHAGHQRSGNLHPVGSSAFLRWPEFGHGLRLDPANDRRVMLERWRGDRDARSFPDSFTRGEDGSAVPWVADSVTPYALDKLNNFDQQEQFPEDGERYGY